MTKKDYELIAKAVHAVRMQYTNNQEMLRSIGTSSAVLYDKVAAVDVAALELASVLSAENPRFNKAKFLEACGVNS